MNITKTSNADKTKNYPQSVKDTFFRYADYQLKMNDRDNLHGKKINSSKLFNKFLAACKSANLDSIQAGFYLQDLYDNK